MANYHSDEWIYSKLNEHYDFIKTKVPESQIVGVFVYGSQNYGLDNSNSDLDTITVVAPSVEDIVFNKAPVSTTEILPNQEHIEVKDVRLIFEQFRKQSPHYLEILYTNYKIIGENYISLWEMMSNNKSRISTFNPPCLLRALAGISRREESKFTIDHECYKSAATVFRIKELVFNYIAFNSLVFENSEPISEYIKKTKLGLNTKHEDDLHEEVVFANEFTQDLVTHYLVRSPAIYPVEHTAAFLDNMQTNFIRRGLELI